MMSSVTWLIHKTTARFSELFSIYYAAFVNMFKKNYKIKFMECLSRRLIPPEFFSSKIQIIIIKV